MNDIKFYKGESISLVFSTYDKDGKPIDISGYTKEVSLFTPFSSKLVKSVTDVSNSAFTVNITGEETSNFEQEGNLNLIVKLKKGDEAKIAKSIPFVLLDPDSAGCGDSGRLSVDSGSIKIDMSIETDFANFDVFFGNGITLIGGEDVEKYISPIVEEMQRDVDKNADNLTDLDKKLYSGADVKEVMPYSNGSYRGYSSASKYLIYENQGVLEGKQIVRIDVPIRVAGTFSLLKAKKTNSYTHTVTLIQTVNINQIGRISLDVDITLNTSESLAFFNTGDTAEINYDQSKVNSAGGAFYYLNNADNTWKIFSGDLCIGIYIAETSENSGDIPTLYKKIEDFNSSLYKTGSNKIANITRTNNKAITSAGVISDNTNYFISSINISGEYTHVDLQTFPTSYGFGGAFYNAENAVIGGFTFTASQTGQGERKNIEIPNGSVKLTFCYGQDAVLVPLNIPIFDYITLVGENENRGIIQRISDLEEKESEISAPADFRSNILPLSNIIYSDINAHVEELNNDISISLPAQTFTDKLYLNGSLSENCSLGFNFETENREENSTVISLVIEREGEDNIVLQRNSYFLLQLLVGSNVITNVPFESPVFLDYKNGKLRVGIADKYFVYETEITNIYFLLKGNVSLSTKYFIRAIKNNLKPIEFDILGLYLPNIASEKIGLHLVAAYWLPSRVLRVSLVDLTSRKVINKDFSNVVLPYSNGILDSHNYLYVGIDPNNGLHIMGNCHATPLYYLYGSNYSDLESLSVSDKLQSSNATYPEFMTNGSSFFATFREGGSGNSTNRVYKFDLLSKTFAKTTTVNIADGTNGKGGTAYFGGWVKLDDWFYNAWCWRRTNNVSTNSQINLIKTKDFISFYGYNDELLNIPIIREENPSYCIDNVPENSGLINQWLIRPFIFNGAVHVWYMKKDNLGYSNIYLIHPSDDGYSTKKVTNYNYDWPIFGTGTIDLDTINVVAVDDLYFLSMHIKHRFCGNNTYKIDKEYNVERLDYQFKELVVPSNRMTVFSQRDNLGIIANTERPYHDRMLPTEDGILRVL